MIQVTCHINGKGCVTIGMLSGFLSIDEDLGLLIDALEVEFYHLALGCGKHLTILALPTRIPTAIGTTGTCNWVGGIGNSPVVR